MARKSRLKINWDELPEDVQLVLRCPVIKKPQRIPLLLVANAPELALGSEHQQPEAFADEPEE